jgi:ParB family transcriptional regulator, chromosome partitioning protein
MTTTTTRGLGRGLSALISENYTPAPVTVPVPDSPVISKDPSNSPAKAATASAETTSATSPVVKTTKDTQSGIDSLLLEQLVQGKYQPRSQFNEQALTELAESIRRNGVMQPIIVRPTVGSRYEIIAGERRWRAAKLAGLNRVPVIIREIDDKQALELALVENVQRQDLLPLEEAIGYQRLIEEFDYTQEELGNIVGKSRSHVTNLLRLLSLPDEIKELLDNGGLSMGHARALIGVPNNIEIAKQIVARGLSVRQAEELGRLAQGNQKRTNSRSQNKDIPVVAHYRSSENRDPDILALEEALSENLGLKVAIHDRGQSGQIVLTYDSLSQLDEILRRLGDGV